MPGAAAPLVVWLLAFSLAAVWNVVYAVYLLWKNKTWARYAWMGWADLIRKFRNVRAGGSWRCLRREAQLLVATTPPLFAGCATLCHCLVVVVIVFHVFGWVALESGWSILRTSLLRCISLFFIVCTRVLFLDGVPEGSLIPFAGGGAPYVLPRHGPTVRNVQNTAAPAMFVGQSPQGTQDTHTDPMNPVAAVSLRALADNRYERVLRGAHSLLRPIAAPVRRFRARGGVAFDHEQHGKVTIWE